jgi:flagellar basal-body rod modification protein FlgD
MDNSQILEQVSQIREIESNARLTETLESVRLGQALSTASSLIGRYVQALTADGTRVEGRVERISVVDGKPVLHIDGHEVELENISEILAEPAEEPEEELGE